MENYKDKLGALAHRIKADHIEVPIQEVNPVKAIHPLLEKEARFNNWIPSSLKRMIKSYGAQNDISQKDITIEALTAFLKYKGIEWKRIE